MSFICYMPKPAAPDKIEILYQDRSLIVAVKPAGVPSQPDKSGGEDLLSMLVSQLGLQSGQLLPVHRLDRPVGGLIVVARTAAAQTALTRQMGDRTMSKSYLAVVCGLPSDQAGELHDYLIKNERLNVSRVVPAGQAGAKSARLFYEVMKVLEIEDGQHLSLLKIRLDTGRHHQIRVQMAHAGWPLWGDTKYNPALRQAGGWHTIALVAAALTFRHPADGRQLEFSLPLPDQAPFSLFYGRINQ